MRQFLPLRLLIPLLLVFLGLAISAIGAAADWYQSGRQTRERTEREALALGHLVVPSIEYAIQQSDAASMEDQIGRLMLVPHLSQAMLFDDVDRVIHPIDHAYAMREIDTAATGIIARARATMAAQTETAPDGTAVYAAFPFFLATEPGQLAPTRVAVLFIQMDLVAPYRESMLLIGQRALLLLAVSLVASLAVAAYLRLTFTRDWTRLVKSVIGYATHGGALEVPRGRGDELARLGEVLNTMVAELTLKREALEESEARFRKLFDGAADSVFLHDVKGRIVDVNESTCRSLGYSEEELRRMQIREIEVGVDPDRLLAAWADIATSGASATVEGVQRRRDGSEFPVEVHIASFDTGKSDLLIAAARDITERKRAADELAASELKFRAIIDASPVPMALNDAEQRVTFLNPAFIATFGYTLDDLPYLFDWWPRAYPDADYRKWVMESWQRDLDLMLRTGATFTPRELDIRCKDGTVRTVLASVASSTTFESNLLIILYDITERIALEQERASLQMQLVQAQKMETVGQLAGGIAHDFNNLLQVILGNLDVAQHVGEKRFEHSDELNEVRRAAERAAELTRQLLAFSRRQVIQPVNVNLNDLIQGILKMLRRVIGEHIELTFLPDLRLNTVRVDKGQFEQIVMNLCVNARDAMPRGGTLTIEARNAFVDGAHCRANASANEGPHVVLSVTDTGIGMDDATRIKIFEPFFTTKDVGKGSGLGLAMVYGIVNQHHGFIEVDSVLGEGTTFRMYIPALQVLEEPSALAHAQEPDAIGGRETILLAEDEPLVRKLFARMLRARGYTVYTAQDGLDALNVYSDHAGAFDLVILDVAMPNLGGFAVMERIQVQHPRTRFLFSSGYSAAALDSELMRERDIRLLHKPYHFDTLLRAIREVLDASPKGPAIP